MTIGASLLCTAILSFAVTSELAAPNATPEEEDDLAWT